MGRAIGVCIIGWFIVLVLILLLAPALAGDLLRGR
jgi:hypothetical protein